MIGTLARLGAIPLVAVVVALPARTAEPKSASELLSCRKAIEEVYWHARTWPEGNPGAKPPLSAVLLEDRLSERVDEAQAEAAALALFGSPITAAQIQAEIDRMARHTRRPAMLREIWAALDGDPDQVAACLVRPILADRLLRDWYRENVAGSSAVGFDAWWSEAKRSLSPAPASADASRFELPPIAGDACADDTWTPARFTPDPRDGHVAVWTGAEMLVWGGPFIEVDSLRPGGRYNPATDTWHPISMINPPSNRAATTAVWTGTEMIVWGGWGGSSTTNVKNTGGRYNPTTDGWTPTSTAGAPSPRSGHAAVWTGTGMIVWGGCPDHLGFCSGATPTGGRYDPATDTWQATSTTGAPSARRDPTAVWTGSRMIVWGGLGASGGLQATGGRYDPVADAWLPTTTVGAPAARDQHTVVWTGTGMIVWGGCGDTGCFTRLATGGRYDPVADAWLPTALTGAPTGRWEHTAVWTGARMVAWGGCVDNECSDQTATGGLYDPAGDAWTSTSTAGAASARASHTAVWSGSEMIVFGGCHSGECQIENNTGGRYDPASNAWIPLGAQRQPTARLNHTAVWTGAEAIVWGGFDALGVTNSGGRYDPATDVWTPLVTPGAPDARDKHTAVWTGTEMIVWGGSVIGIGAHNSGGRYNPTTNTWAATSFTGAPSPRIVHTAVWTGTRMIVWGGCITDTCSSFTDTGGRYDPATNSWQATATTGAPASRAFHRAVWSGSEMIVWGGGLPATHTGGRYDPATDAWLPTSLADAPSARTHPEAAWSGTQMIVWGGSNGSAVLGDGGRYDPAADAWQPVSSTGAPAARVQHTAVQAGDEMIVWGGCADTLCATTHFTGGRYDPAADAWRPTSTGPFTPFGRSLHEPVWTGTQMMVWGGWRGTSATKTNTGALYCATAAPGAPGDVEQLLVGKNGNGSDLDLGWSPSCSGEATDYAVYAGTLGTWYSHAIEQCSTGGSTSTTLTPTGGSAYYLVAPIDSVAEGSYGRDGSGSERPAAAVRCRATQTVAPCP